jgi:5-methylcytosine-specific restriction enzyme A
MTWHRTSAQSRGYGHEWLKLRLLVMRRDSHLCQACWRKGRPTPGTEVHHRIPKAAGGTDDMTNLETLCHQCHLEADAAARGYTIKPRYNSKGYRIADK